MPKNYSSHAPGHVRDTACAAIEAFLEWSPGESEPMVDYEINYVPRKISISAACGLVWNCSDILPRSYVEMLKDAELGLRRHTYAAAAQAMLATIKQRSAA